MNTSGYNSFYTGKQIDAILKRVEQIFDGASEDITLSSLYDGINKNSLRIEEIYPLLNNKVSKDGDIIEGTLYITDELIVPMINSTGSNSIYKAVTIKNSDDFAGYQQAGKYLYKIEEKQQTLVKPQYVQADSYIEGTDYYIADTSGINSLQIDTLNTGVTFGTGQMTKIQNDKVYGAIWNDYAEYRESSDLEPGRVIIEQGDGHLERSTKRLEPGAEIISDTFGCSMGQTEKCQTPIAVAGRVLAYPNEKYYKYKPGDPVCSGPNGTVSKMTRREVRKYPDRIIGTVSEIPTYDTWGPNNIKVDGRIWIRVR